MSNTSLRFVTLCGPSWTRDGPPLWEIVAAAPKLRRDGDGLLQDRIHPLRVLQTDPLPATAGPDNEFRRPHVMSLHVLAGHGAGPFRSNLEEEDEREDFFFSSRKYPPGLREGLKPANDVQLLRSDEALRLRLPTGDGTHHLRDVRSEIGWKYFNDDTEFLMPPYWHTRRMEPAERAKPEDPNKRIAAQFQHVLAEPVLAPNAPWPPAKKDAIDLPPFNLLAGAIEVAVAEGGLPWLGVLEPVRPAGTQPIHRYPVRFVPEGIELRTKVGFLGQRLEGWFRITPAVGAAGEERLLLTLLPGRTEEAQLAEPWRKAWKRAVPDASDVELLEGFHVQAHTNMLPAFQWELQADTRNAGQQDSPTQKDHAPGNNLHRGPRIYIDFDAAPVHVPAEAIRLELLSPRARLGVDGVVTVSGGYFQLGRAAAMKAYGDKRMPGDYDAFAAIPADSLVLSWCSDGAPKLESSWKIIARELKTEGELRVAPAVGDTHPLTGKYRCAHNERQLAATLREAYGVPAASDEADAPPLFGFVPLRDGWLQLPVANKPPQDARLDNVDPAEVTSRPKNVLSGFLRFGNEAALPGVFSAFEKSVRDEPPVRQSPWQVTIEAAAGLRLAVQLAQKPLSTVPVLGLVLIDEPELSTRGLLWMSTDRPDASEALPRIGAGPGAYVDVAFDRLDREAESLVQVGIGALKIATTVAAQGRTAQVERKQLELTLASKLTHEDARTVRWQRHPWMPLAAQLPLTRTARSAVRPLESRDLVPFSATTTKPHETTRLADLSWSGSDSLPSAVGDWRYELHPRWPGSRKAAANAGEEATRESTECRLTWAAVGAPGAEVLPLEGGGIWKMLVAHRFDMPPNDEGLALATMPAAFADAAPPQPDAAPLLPVSALDWPGLAAHWRELQRLAKLSRTSHSYIAGFKPEGNLDAVDVISLVGGRSWSIPKLGFTAPDGAQAMSYGTVQFGNGQPWTGNRVLLGYSGKLADSGGKLVDTQASDDATIEVVGYSPSSFALGTLLVDARGVGSGAIASIAGGRWRPLATPWNKDLTGLVGTSAAIPLAAGVSLAFWFRDLPLTTAGTFKATSTAVEPDAWQDGRLESRSFEWRLTSAAPSDAGFADGDDAIPFFGMRLQPLRLQDASFEMKDGLPASAVPKTATVLARLHAGPREESVDDGGNLVELALVSRDGQLELGDLRLRQGAALVFGVRLVGSGAIEPTEAPAASDDAASFAFVKATGLGWKLPVLTLSGVSLDFDFLGSRVHLSGATATHAGNEIVIDWTAASAPQPGTISVRRARLCAGDQTAELRFLHRVQLARTLAHDPRPTLEVETVARWGGHKAQPQWPPELAYASASAFRLLGLAAKVRFTAARRAFAVVAAEGARAGEELMPGFGISGDFRMGLLASIDSFDANAAVLQAVHLAAQVQRTDYSPGALQLDALELRVERHVRDGGGSGAASAWRGELVLHGELAGTSAIAWPALVSEPIDVPIPGKATKQTTTTTSVELEGTDWIRHEVKWRLDGHVMPLDTAIGLARGETAAWSVPIAARHSLRHQVDKARDVAFTSVDTIVLGAIQTLAPRWDSPGADLSAGSTFAARYRDDAPDSPNAGMASPGRGGLGTVLGGLNGALFRRDYYAEDARRGPELVVTGGFTGLLAAAEQACAPLLRLPALVALQLGPLQVAEDSVPPLQQNGAKQWSVAWPDGTAAQPIAIPASAPTPQSLSMPDLVRAAEGGRRVTGAAGTGRERLYAAMLVEQSFPANLPTGLGLSATPYFLGSAVSISLALRHLADRPAATVYSLVSLVDKVGDYRQGAASLLAVSAVASDATRPLARLAAALAVAGDDISVTTWEDRSEGVSLAAVREIAWVNHSKPRLALLASPSGAHQVMRLPQASLQPARRSVPVPMFSDAAHGFQLPASDSAVLAGPQEGWTSPARAESGPHASGLAALSRRATLPGFSAAEAEVSSAAWISQQRVPVYLPAETLVDSVTIPWLDPGSARARLPVGEEVAKVLDRVFEAAAWQPQLPASVTTASVSDRPGVLVARRLRVELPAARPSDAPGQAFDPGFPRFGQPGQASSSLARTERTPRPAPLAPNTGNALADRRPCVSRLLAKTNSRPLLGPADIVSGSTKADGLGAGGVELNWSIAVVGLPATRGVLSAPWDGTFELVAEVTANADRWVGDAKPDAAQAFAMLLLEPTGIQSRACASLVVNGEKLAFRSLHVLQATPWLPVDGEDRLRRARVRLVLDMREEKNAAVAPGTDNGVLAALVKADAAAAPKVECHLTVYPSASVEGAWTSQAIYKLAPSSDGKPEPLPNGRERAPITLRLPVYLVTATRGALPLEPASVLFTDPAYDAGLSSPPAESRVRVPAAAGTLQPRGELSLTLSADRQRVNRAATVTLMADLRFEKRLPPQLREKLGDTVNGDMQHDARLEFELCAAVQPRTGPRRPLNVSPLPTSKLELVVIEAGVVYELPLPWLVEENGSPAVLAPGDVLEFTAIVTSDGPVNLLDEYDGTQPKWTAVSGLKRLEASLVLRLTVTAEPVVEPPPGLYAALLRTAVKANAAEAAICVPLHAQSPLPTRVELPTAREDFRNGLMRRSATFAWSLVRPADESGRHGVYVLKSDRNGQTWLPEAPGEFLRFESTTIR